MKIIFFRLSQFVLVVAPLVAMPLMLTVHWDAMIAPNEEPKWAIFVVLGALLLSAGLLLGWLRCRESASSPPRPSLSLPAGLLLLFLVGMAAGVAWTVNPGEGLNRLAFWCSAGVTLAAVAWAARHVPGYTRRLSWTIVLSATLLSGMFWAAYFLDFSRPDFNKFVQFSPVGHFNFTADVLMTLIPLLAWSFMIGSPTLRWLAGFSLASSAFMLLTSGSLGGMGGMAVGALVTSVLALSRSLSTGQFGHWRPGRRALLAGLAVLGLLLMASQFAFEHMPREYREQMFVRGEWGEPPQASDLDQAQSLPPLVPLWVRILPYLGSRTPMWAATTGMVAEHPWRGFGTGSYVFEYPGYSKRYDLFGDFETRGVRAKTNPHNVLLQISSENGIPLTLLFLGLYGWLTVRVMRQAWREPSALWLSGTWALWAVFLDAQVNHVFFNPASLFMAAIGLGLWAGHLPAPATAAWPLCRVFRWPLVPAVIAGAGFWLAAQPLQWVVSEYFVAEAMRSSAASPPASPREILTTWVKARVWSPTNVQALYGLATATMKLNQTESAEAYLHAFLKLAPNHSAGLNLLATLQAKSGRLDEAEKTLERALQLEPDATTLRENLQALRQTKDESRGTGATRNP